MTDMPGTAAHARPMAGTLDGFANDFRTALARFDHDRRSSFFQPGQRTAATNRFEQALINAVNVVRAADRTAVRAQQETELAAAVASQQTLEALKLTLRAEHQRVSELERTQAALEGQLVTSVAEAGQLREALATAGGTAERQSMVITGLREQLASLEGDLAAVRNGQDAAPEPPPAAPAPALPRRNGPPRLRGRAQAGPKAQTHTPGTPSGPKPSEGRTAPGGN